MEEMTKIGEGNGRFNQELGKKEKMRGDRRRGAVGGSKKQIIKRKKQEAEIKSKKQKQIIKRKSTKQTHHVRSDAGRRLEIRNRNEVAT